MNRIENLSSGEKRKLLVQLLQKRAKQPKQYPLSFAQERLWFLDQLHPGTPLYNVSAAVRVTGRVRAPAFEYSLNEIVKRHEALRTTFESIEGRPVQVVRPELQLVLPEVDLRELTKAECQAQARELGITEAMRPFDLAHGPLLRFTLLRLGNDQSVVLLSMHHIICDAWSLFVFLSEAIKFYEAFNSGQPVRLPKLPITYGDFAVWQRQWLQDEVLARQLSYWQEQLGDSLPILELPLDHPRPAVQTHRAGKRSTVLAKPVSESLKQLSQREGVTLFMTLLAALHILLHRYTGQANIVTGAAVAGRDRAEVEGLIGLFINALVLRTETSGNPSFRELLRRVKSAAMGAYAHADVPFEKLVEELKPDRDRSRTPLFQVFFDMHNLPNDQLSGQRTEVAGIEVEVEVLSEVGAKFDLTLYARERVEGIELSLVYSADLFTEARMAEMLEQMTHLLSQIVANPEESIDRLSLVTPAIRASLPDPASVQHDTWEGAIHTLFSRQALRIPEQLAVKDFSDSWTYEELDARSNQLANHLRADGIQAQDVVTVYGHRSASLALALLGILKAGAAFVILDPAYPVARLIDYLMIAQPSAWLQLEAAGPLPEKLAASLTNRSCYRLEIPQRPSRISALLKDDSMDDPGVAVGPDDLAYIAFTSGSTGQPKGVLGRHGPITHFLPWIRETFDLNQSDRFSVLSGLSYNPLQREIFTPLFLGGTLYIPDPTVITSPRLLTEWIAREQISVIHLTPAMGQILKETTLDTTLPSLRCAFFAGDVLRRHDVAMLQHMAPNATVINHYGATETQRAVGYFIIPAGDEVYGNGPDEEQLRQTIPLGKGIRDVQLLVLNTSQQLAGVGELGEIYVRSPHLAKGYKGDDALTDERFVLNPFTTRPGDRLYKTAELGRYLPDGNVEFVSRADQRVKIRGFRVEPGEIELILAQHSAVKEVIVLAREERSGDTRLLAYVVPAQGAAPTSSELRSFVAAKLPDYMIPSIFMLLDAMPLTPNGKVDRRALPVPDRAGTGPQVSFVAPRTELEDALARVWAEVLGVKKVGVHDNFFELGGHSLMAVRLISRLQGSFKLPLELHNLFDSPTVAGLAHAIDTAGDTDSAAACALDADLSAEVVLDPAICPTAKTAGRVTEPVHALLTGATGFLGAFLLHELLQQTQADIHCLVRSSNVEEGRRRLEKQLESYALWDESQASRIIPVPGDLSQPLFGLSDEGFEELGNKIDVIYHNGAWVNFVYPYAKLKATNVLGTQEVLRLASQFEVKPVHFISTTSVFSAAGNSDVNIVREDDELGHSKGLQTGYAQSKWVAEKLVGIARSRGLPTCIYRPGWITGHSQTGVSNTNDLLSRTITSCIQLGTVPDVNLKVNMTPVDYVSRAIVQLSRGNNSSGKTYHLVNTQPISLSEILDWIVSFGYPLKRVPYDQWQEEVGHLAKHSRKDALFLLSPLVAQKIGAEQAVQFDTAKTIAGLRGTTINCPPANASLLGTYVSYLLRDSH